MTREQLTELIITLTQERDAFIQEANQRVAFLNGKLAAIQDLLTALDAADSATAEGNAGE